MLTRTAGVELAPHNILVVGVGPGAVATPINISTMQDPKKLAKLDAAIPLGRMAQPKEPQGVQPHIHRFSTKLGLLTAGIIVIP